MNVALDCPAATTTEAGVVTEDELLDNVTEMPPVPAGPVNLTVPVELAPPVTLVGLKLKDASDGGPIVRVAVLEVDPRVAVMIAETEALTAVVLTLNEAELAPADTVTVAGVVALVLPEERLTIAPPDGAGPLRVTVPVEELPPTSEVGFKVKPVNVAGVTVSVAVTDVLPNSAVMVAVVEDVTAPVVIVNAAELAPAATVTVERGTTLLLLDDRETTVPPVGAGPVRVSVPVELVPPGTDVGETVRFFGTADVIVSVVETLTPPREAVTFAGVDVATAEVEMLNVAVVAPAATVTLEGVVALELFEERLTTVPPFGAAELIVTVPVEDAPPKTDVGETVKLVGSSELMVRTVVAVTPPAEAEIVASVVEETDVVAIVNFADVAPEATVTVAGGIAALLLDVNATTVPPEGAGIPSVTVPVEAAPPITVDGETVTPVNPPGVTVNVAVAFTEPDVALMTALVLSVTGFVRIVKVAVVAPEGTKTNPGAEAAVLPLMRLTTSPVAGAGPARVT